MSRIALFGSDSNEGMEFITVALRKGHEIKTLDRNRKKFVQNQSRFLVQKGDILNYDNVIATIRDCDVVVNLVEHYDGCEDWLQTNGIKNILSAMKIENVNKIIMLSRTGFIKPEEDSCNSLEKLKIGIRKIVADKYYNDTLEHYKIIKSSGVKWIYVRAPKLVGNSSVKIFKVAWVGENGTKKIENASLAEFIVNQVDDDQFIFQMPLLIR